jgi:branched-chain amino acid transport system ATP-binding protein
MLDTTTPLLAIKDLQAWYGESHILHGVNFDVHEGEVVTLLGRNGAGKTTTLKSIMGIVGQRTGSVRFEGRELIATASNHIARAGIAICPEERGIFASGAAGRTDALSDLRAVSEFEGTARLQPGD